MNINFYNRIQQMKAGGNPTSSNTSITSQSSAYTRPDISYIVYHSLVSSIKGVWSGARLEVQDNDIVMNFGDISAMDTKVVYNKVIQRFLYILQLNHINYILNRTNGAITISTNPPDPRLNILNPKDFIQQFVLIPKYYEGYVKITTDEEHRDTFDLIIKYMNSNI